MKCLCFKSAAELYVYATCVMLGISMLMPVQAITSAPSYMVFYYKYVTRDPDAVPNNTTVWANILTFYNLVSVVTQIIVGPTVLLPAARKLSLTIRFILALSLMMVEVLVVVVLPVGGVSQTSALIAFFIVTSAAGAGKSYLEATCYALVGAMPPRFMSAVMFGCGFSGVVASTLQCIIKASMEDTYEAVLTQSYIYFSLALGIMAISLVMALCLRFNSYAQKYVGEFRKYAKDHGIEPARDEEDEEEENNNNNEPGNKKSGNSNSNHNEPGSRKSEPVIEGNVVLEENSAAVPKLKNLEEEEEASEVRAVVDDLNDNELQDDRHLSTSEQLQQTRVWPIIKLIYPVQISCFCVFFVSLFIFPSLIIPIDRTDKWFSTIAILLYNCGDATGRLSSSLKFLWPPRWVLVMVGFIRFIYIMLIFLCIYKYIPGHAAPYVFLATLGLTKGFFGATSMVYGPNTPGLKTEGQRVMAGQLMGISLLAGASASALLALLVVMFLP